MESTLCNTILITCHLYDSSVIVLDQVTLALETQYVIEKHGYNIMGIYCLNTEHGL